MKTSIAVVVAATVLFVGFTCLPKGAQAQSGRAPGTDLRHPPATDLRPDRTWRHYSPPGEKNHRDSFRRENRYLRQQRDYPDYRPRHQPDRRNYYNHRTPDSRRGKYYSRPPGASGWTR